MKKSLGLFLSAATLFTLALGVSVNKSDTQLPLEEGTALTQDYIGEQVIARNKGLVGKDSDISISKTFVQYGKNANGLNVMRFATAVKGDISSIAYTRSASGLEDKVVDVTTVYKGISSGSATYYYNGSDISTDEQYAGDYYWACYTIAFKDSTYAKSDITASISVQSADAETEPVTSSRSENLDHLANNSVVIDGVMDDYIYNDSVKATKYTLVNNEKNYTDFYTVRNEKGIYVYANQFVENHKNNNTSPDWWENDNVELRILTFEQLMYYETGNIDRLQKWGSGLNNGTANFENSKVILGNEKDDRGLYNNKYEMFISYESLGVSSNETLFFECGANLACGWANCSWWYSRDYAQFKTYTKNGLKGVYASENSFLGEKITSPVSYNRATITGWGDIGTWKFLARRLQGDFSVTVSFEHWGSVSYTDHTWGDFCWRTVLPIVEDGTYYSNGFGSPFVTRLDWFGWVDQWQSSEGVGTYGNQENVDKLPVWNGADNFETIIRHCNIALTFERVGTTITNNFSITALDGDIAGHQYTYWTKLSNVSLSKTINLALASEDTNITINSLKFNSYQNVD